MATKKETITTILFSILGLLSAFAAGFIIHGWIYPPELNLQILSEAQSALLEYAYDSPPEKPALEYGMIHGMVQAYNEPYTIFVEPPQHELETDILEGRFGGIGVTLGRDNDNYIVLYPFHNTRHHLCAVTCFNRREYQHQKIAESDPSLSM